MADLEEKVKEIIAKELGVEREKLTNDASFMEDLGADSLDTVELVMEFEKEFNIDIPDEDAEKLRTVGDALDLSQVQVGVTQAQGRRHRPRGHNARRQRRGDDLAVPSRGTFRCGADHEVRFRAVRREVRVRGEGLRSVRVHGAEGSEARRSLHAVRRRRPPCRRCATPKLARHERVRSRIASA